MPRYGWEFRSERKGARAKGSKGRKAKDLKKAQERKTKEPGGERGAAVESGPFPEKKKGRTREERGNNKGIQETNRNV